MDELRARALDESSQIGPVSTPPEGLVVAKRSRLPGDSTAKVSVGTAAPLSTEWKRDAPKRVPSQFPSSPAPAASGSEASSPFEEAFARVFGLHGSHPQLVDSNVLRVPKAALDLFHAQPVGDEDDLQRLAHAGVSHGAGLLTKPFEEVHEIVPDCFVERTRVASPADAAPALVWRISTLVPSYVKCRHLCMEVGPNQEKSGVMCANGFSVQEFLSEYRIARKIITFSGGRLDRDTVSVEFIQEFRVPPFAVALNTVDGARRSVKLSGRISIAGFVPILCGDFPESPDVVRDDYTQLAGVFELERAAASDADAGALFRALCSDSTAVRAMPEIEDFSNLDAAIMGAFANVPMALPYIVVPEPAELAYPTLDEE